MQLAVSDLISEFAAVMPGNILLVAGIVMLIVGLIPKLAQRTFSRALCSWLALASLGLSGLCAWLSQDVASTASQMFVVDGLTHAGSGVAILGGALIVLLGWHDLRADRATEYFGCLLLMIAGLVYAAASADLISLYLGLELVSIPTTVILSITRSDDSGREVTLKYFALAVFTSAFFLLGCSYLYGIAGSTSLSVIRQSLADDHTIFAGTAISLALCGLCFRITAVPFHFYAPDVISGSALPAAAGLSFIPKVAGFVGIARLLGGETLDAALADHTTPTLLVIAGLTMTLGNILALIQTRLRRLLAYSGIAHSGYLLLTVAALLSNGASIDVVFDYLTVYVTMTLAVFACLAVLESENGSLGDDLTRLTGLHARRPGLAVGTAIACLGLAGLPLTAGFWAKLQVLIVSLSTGRTDVRIVAILMVFNAVVAAVYYVSIAVRLFAAGASDEPSVSSKPVWGPSAACACCALLTVLWFFVP